MKMKLSLRPSSEDPIRNSDVSQYLITNDAAYYNDVEVFFKDGKFCCFKGWDNGEWTEFKRNMYAYWAEIPKNVD